MVAVYIAVHNLSWGDHTQNWIVLGTQYYLHTYSRQVFINYFYYTIWHEKYTVILNHKPNALGQYKFAFFENILSFFI